jgi:hypothetical protein
MERKRHYNGIFVKKKLRFGSLFGTGTISFSGNSEAHFIFGLSVAVEISHGVSTETVGLFIAL